MVSGGAVYVLEHDGQLKWGPLALPGGGLGGAPSVADVDADGAPEILVAGDAILVAIEGDGSLRWQAPLASAPSSLRGATAYDFEGDGQAEVVVADQQRLLVLKGSDGTLVAEPSLGGSAGAGVGSPILADVDADGAAEVLVAASGLHVLGADGEPWLGTRGIWNQHAYDVTNVLDDGTVPALAVRSWEANNSFRLNKVGTRCELPLPDLVASFARRTWSVDMYGFPLELVQVRIGNRGPRPSPANVPIAFYDGDPQLGRFVGQVNAGAISPGAYTEVYLSTTGVLAKPLWVVADDDGTAHGVVVEADETNNAHETALYIGVRNEAPEVSAVVQPAQPMLPDATVSLDGTVSDDGEPTGELTTLWSVVSGPGPVVFADPTSVDTTASFSVNGDYRLQLQAEDGEYVAGVTLTVHVHPENLPPQVSAGANQEIEASYTMLTGTVSDDGLPPLSALAVLWTKLSGPGEARFAAPDAPVTLVSFSAAGTYLLQLEASDGLASRSATVTVVVAARNMPPTVSAGTNQTLTLPLAAVSLDGTVTDDGLPAGSTLTRTWSVLFAPGPVTLATPTAEDTLATISGPGVYVFKLTASDGVLEQWGTVVVIVNPAPPSGAAPRSLISSPAPPAEQPGALVELSGPTQVLGTAASETLASWKLEHRPSGGVGSGRRSRRGRPASRTGRWALRSRWHSTG